jgi:hypothetical protein
MGAGYVVRLPANNVDAIQQMRPERLNDLSERDARRVLALRLQVSGDRPAKVNSLPSRPEEGFQSDNDRTLSSIARKLVPFHCYWCEWEGGWIGGWVERGGQSDGGKPPSKLI